MHYNPYIPPMLDENCISSAVTDHFDSPTDEDTIGLFYDKENNVFTDEDGYIIWYIFDFITPNDLYMFKKNRQYMLVSCQSMPGTLCELFYPEDDDDYDYDSSFEKR